MWYKPYGQTGRQISVVSFGGMRLSQDADVEANAAVVRYAFDRGINYFDTAPSYTRSEETFGVAFREMNRDGFYVSTKSNKPSGDALRKDLETSLERMGVDYIDFFHIWYVLSLESWKQRLDGGAVAAALRAREEGLVRHVAVSSHMSGEDIKQMLTEGPFEGVTLGYCAINFPYRDLAVRTAGEMGLGVITMNPLGGGLIPQHAEKFDFIREPEDFSSSSSVVAAAIRFNVSNPDITAALVGLTTKEQVDEAVEAVENFQPYDPAHVDAVRKRIVSRMNELCTGCGYCLPCPNGVPIPAMMDAYNLKLLGDEQAMAERMKWHWGVSSEQAAECTRCGQCEDRCTQHLPICDRLAELADVKMPD